MFDVIDAVLIICVRQYNHLGVDIWQFFPMALQTNLLFHDRLNLYMQFEN